MTFLVDFTFFDLFSRFHPFAFLVNFTLLSFLAIFTPDWRLCTRVNPRKPTRLPARPFQPFTLLPYFNSTPFLPYFTLLPFTLYHAYATFTATHFYPFTTLLHHTGTTPRYPPGLRRLGSRESLRLFRHFLFFFAFRCFRLFIFLPLLIAKHHIIQTAYANFILLHTFTHTYFSFFLYSLYTLLFYTLFLLFS